MFRTELIAPLTPGAGEEEVEVGEVKREDSKNTACRAQPVIALMMSWLCDSGLLFMKASECRILDTSHALSPSQSDSLV